MSVSNLQSTTSSAAYLTSRFSAVAPVAKSEQGVGPSGFGRVLEDSGSPQAPSVEPVAISTPPVSQSGLVPFASFIDNIDFSKFKSDPLHFGKFIPIEQEVTSPVSEQIAKSSVAEVGTTPSGSIESLMGSIEAQLSYASSSSAAAAGNANQAKVQDDSAVPGGDELVAGQSASERLAYAQLASQVIEQQAADTGLVSSGEGTQVQASGDLTQLLTTEDSSLGYNAAEILAEVLADDEDKDAS